MSVPVLTYFGFRGLGEPIRLFFEDHGIAYQDRRIGMTEEWTALKPQMQFGQMPRLEEGDATLFQSQAILRHLARPLGLCGETEAERVRCDISAEAGRDLQQRLWDHFWSPGSNTPDAAAAYETGELPGQLALESGMACGFGACFGCVVPTVHGYIRLCLDGPVLDAQMLPTAAIAGVGH